MDYRIEYTIFRGDEEVGFGSSGEFFEPRDCVSAIQSTVDNYDWETEPGMPDPRSIKSEVEDRNNE